MEKAVYLTNDRNIWIEPGRDLLSSENPSCERPTEKIPILMEGHEVGFATLNDANHFVCDLP